MFGKISYQLLHYILLQKRHRVQADAFIVSVNTTHWLFVTAEKIWPQRIFRVERCFSQTSGSISVALAQQLLTLVLQVICKHRNTCYCLFSTQRHSSTNMDCCFGGFHSNFVQTAVVTGNVWMSVVQTRSTFIHSHHDGSFVTLSQKIKGILQVKRNTVNFRN